MSGKLYIAILWHMHQPLYKDPLENFYHLPWVRLHSIREYIDMPSVALRFPEAKMTFNLVPSLLMQIDDYVHYNERGISDLYLDMSLKPAKELTIEDRMFILKYFFMNNWGNVIRKIGRYDDLLRKRGYIVDDANLEGIATQQFTTDDFRDLQVLFNAGWFGFEMKKREDIKNFLRKPFYVEDDKRWIVERQFNTIKKVIPLYVEGYKRKQFELSFTPFYHPILPLLIDNYEKTRVGMPHCKLPRYNFKYPEDAYNQIKMGKEYFNEIIGVNPVGMWPSEGSVCDEVIDFAASNGVKWLATDEEILFNTLGYASKDKTLYKPYIVEINGKSVYVFFRDKKLSDMIGFDYSKMSADDAVNDLLSRLTDIYKVTNESADDNIVSIVLDGENAWEYYYDLGEEFLSKLYDRILNDSRFEMITFSEYIERFPEKPKLTHIYPGSWIGHNFDIWIGDREENAAWDRLKETRDFIEVKLKSGSIPEDVKDKVWHEIFAAEGSDWFWWYGYDFTSINDKEYDYLFRQHLINVYKLLKEDVPDILDIPIREKQKVENIQPPATFIYPEIDGKISSYYEWEAAGFLDIDRTQGAMKKTTGSYIKKLFYGFNENTLFIRLDPYKFIDDMKGYEIVIKFMSQGPVCRVMFEVSKGNDELYIKYPGEEKEGIEGYLSIDRIIEVGIPFMHLHVYPGDKIFFHVSLKDKDGVVMQRIPMDGVIEVEMPTEYYKLANWSV